MDKLAGTDARKTIAHGWLWLGLSYLASEVGDILPQSAIDDVQSAKPIHLSDRFVSKDLMYITGRGASRTCSPRFFVPVKRVSPPLDQLRLASCA
jgi:hypothetical protein